MASDGYEMDDGASSSTRPLVYIVDDNKDQVEAIEELLASRGMSTRTYTSGAQFLQLDNFPAMACLLIDNHMPGMSGLEVQAELANRNMLIPIVFMSGDSTFKHVVRALKKGAHEFLQKPFTKDDLFESIETAISEQLNASQPDKKAIGQNSKLELLTSRELQVLKFVSLGYTNKMISNELTIVVSTVEFHRANLMKKLQANSLADLIALTRED